MPSSEPGRIDAESIHSRLSLTRILIKRLSDNAEDKAVLWKIAKTGYPQQRKAVVSKLPEIPDAEPLAEWLAHNEAEPLVRIALAEALPGLSNAQRVADIMVGHEDNLEVLEAIAKSLDGLPHAGRVAREILKVRPWDAVGLTLINAVLSESSTKPKCARELSSLLLEPVEALLKPVRVKLYLEAQFKQASNADEKDAIKMVMELMDEHIHSETVQIKVDFENRRLIKPFKGHLIPGIEKAALPPTDREREEHSGSLQKPEDIEARIKATPMPSLAE